MSQIHREALTRYETVTLDYQIPVWKESGNDDATLKRITLQDFFASDLVSSVLDAHNWSSGPLTVTGDYTHNLDSHKIILTNGTYEFANTVTFKMLGSMYLNLPSIPQDDTLEKLTVFDPTTGQVKWREVSSLPGITDGDKGDIVVASSGASMVIDTGAVSNAKLADVATSTFKGRTTAGTGAPEDLTATQARTILNVEDGADVTDTTNVTAAGALMDSEVTDLAGIKAVTISTLQVKPTEGAFVDGDKTKLDGIEALADITDATNVEAAGALMDSEVTDLAGIKGVTISTLQVKPTEGAFVDGDKTKLDGIETGADVTDATNVAGAGALMDSEVTNLAQVKSFDSADYATAAQGALADSAQQPPSEGAFVNGDKTKLDGIETGATADQTDSEIETAYNNQVAVVSQVDAEAGTSTDVKRWTPQRVKQAIDALAGGTPALTNGEIFVGNVSNAATSVAMSGDTAITNAGVVTIQADAVTYDKMQDTTQACILGNTTGSGTVQEIPSVSQYLSAGAVATLLENTSNWDVNGNYTGSSITGTFQGQAHYDGNYWFTAVADNTWIRLIRG